MPIHDHRADPAPSELIGEHQSGGAASYDQHIGIHAISLQASFLTRLARTPIASFATSTRSPGRSAGSVGPSPRMPAYRIVLQQAPVDFRGCRSSNKARGMSGGGASPPITTSVRRPGHSFPFFPASLITFAPFGE